MNASEKLWKMKDPVVASETVQDHRNLLDWTETSLDNATQHKLPINMRFNEGHQLSIIVYSILMVFSAIANTTVLVLIVKRRRKTPSRINTMLMHLAIADLLVSVKMQPRENLIKL
jgi:gonadotropin-releasing hormone receptor